MDDIIKKEVVSSQYASELLFAVYPEPIWNQVTEFSPTERVPIFILAYRFEKEISKGKYLYVFSGARLQ